MPSDGVEILIVGGRVTMISIGLDIVDTPKLSFATAVKEYLPLRTLFQVRPYWFAPVIVPLPIEVSFAKNSTVLTPPEGLLTLAVIAIFDEGLNRLPGEGPVILTITGPFTRMLTASEALRPPLSVTTAD